MCVCVCVCVWVWVGVCVCVWVCVWVCVCVCVGVGVCVCVCVCGCVCVCVWYMASLMMNAMLCVPRCSYWVLGWLAQWSIREELLLLPLLLSLKAALITFANSKYSALHLYKS